MWLDETFSDEQVRVHRDFINHEPAAGGQQTQVNHFISESVVKMNVYRVNDLIAVFSSQFLICRSTVEAGCNKDSDLCHRVGIIGFPGAGWA